MTTAAELSVEITSKANLKGFDKANKATDKLSKGVGKAGKAIGVMGKAAALGGVAAAGAIAGIGIASVKSAMQFERQMRQVATLGADFGKPFKEVQMDVSRLAKEMGVDAVDAANALYDAVSAGIPPENALTFLEKATDAAVAGEAKLSDVGSAMAVVMNSWGDAAGDAGNITDKLFATIKTGVTTMPELAANIGNVAGVAAAAGVSFDETAAALAQVTTKGITTSVASTQLKSAMSELMKPSDDLAVALKAIGYESGTAALEALGLGGTMDALNDYALDAGVGVNTLFGKVEAGNAALALSGENADAYAEKLAGVQNSAGMTQEALDKVNEGFSRQVDLLKGQVTGTLREIGLTLLPVLTDALKTAMPTIRDIADRFAAWATGQAATLPEKIATLTSKVSELWPKIESLLSFMGEHAGAITKVAVAVGGLSIAFSVLGPIIGGASGIIGMLGGGAGLAGVVGTLTAVLTGPVLIAIVGIGAAFVLWAEHGEAVRTKMGEIGVSLGYLQQDAETAEISMHPLLEALNTPISDIFAPVGEALGLLDENLNNSSGKAAEWKDNTVTSFTEMNTATTGELASWDSETRAVLDSWADDGLVRFQEYNESTVGELTDWATNSDAQVTAFDDTTRKTLGEWWTDTDARFTTWVEDQVDGISTWYADTDERFTGWATDTWGTLTTWWTDTDARFTTWVTDGIASIGQWKDEQIGAITGWASDTGATIRTWASDMTARFTTWKDNTITAATTVATDVLAELTRMKDDGIQAIKDFASDFASELSALASEVYEKAKEIGNDVVRGLKDGIEAKIQDAIDTAKRAVGQVIAATREALDATSPSKEFIKIGHDVVAGMAIGIEESGTLVLAAMGGVIGGLTGMRYGYGGIGIGRGVGHNAGRQTASGKAASLLQDAAKTLVSAANRLSGAVTDAGNTMSTAAQAYADLSGILNSSSGRVGAPINLPSRPMTSGGAIGKATREFSRGYGWVTDMINSLDWSSLGKDFKQWVRGSDLPDWLKKALLNPQKAGREGGRWVHPAVRALFERRRAPHRGRATGIAGLVAVGGAASEFSDGGFAAGAGGGIRAGNLMPGLRLSGLGVGGGGAIPGGSIAPSPYGGVGSLGSEAARRSGYQAQQQRQQQQPTPVRIESGRMNGTVTLTEPFRVTLTLGDRELGVIADAVVEQLSGRWVVSASPGRP